MTTAERGEELPNNDEVICPNCVHQFRAIPVNVQTRIAEMEAALAERTRERDAAIALVAELVQIENDHDDVVFVRLYGKPHTPEHKARVLDLRQRKTDAWRKARVAIAAALAEPPR